MALTVPIDVRFRDLDALGHVNNAVYLTYLEVARQTHWEGFPSTRPFTERGYLVAHVSIDYRQPVLLGQELRVEVELAEVGRSSFTLGYRVLGPEGCLHARARSVQVMMDFLQGRPSPLEPEEIAFLRARCGEGA